jgi:hypothetical protein
MTKTISETLAIHIITVYDTMEAKSEETDDLRIYTGNVSILVRELGISMTFYKTIFRVLYDGGYCAMGDRGARGKPSTIVLLQRPEKDELMDLTDHTISPILSLVRELETVKSSLGGLHVVGVVAELEKRLIAVEERLKIDGKTKK